MEQTRQGGIATSSSTHIPPVQPMFYFVLTLDTACPGEGKKEEREGGGREGEKGKMKMI